MFNRIAVGTAIILLMIAARPAHLNAAAQSIQLVDQRGKTFDFGDLRGGTVVLTFVSAHCTDACPLINAQFEQTVKLLAHRPVAVRFVTVTLDPERDSALDMRRMAKEFEANPTRWIVAWGKAPDVHALMRRFHVETQRDEHGYATAHTSFVYILDPQLHVRRTLLASSDLGEQLAQEVSQ